MIFVWLALMVWTLTIAALFRYDLLLLLFMTEVVLLVFFLVLPRYFRRHLSVQIPQAVISHVGDEADVPVTLTYTGRLPAPIVRAKIDTGYGTFKGSTDYGVRPSFEKGSKGSHLERGKKAPSAKTERKKEKGRENGDGKAVLKAYVPTPHFGEVRARLRWIRVYEYLGIFGVRIPLNGSTGRSLSDNGNQFTGASSASGEARKNREKGKGLHKRLPIAIYVIPEEKTGFHKAAVWERSGEEGERPAGVMGQDEIAGIRDFREGDRMRAVSWQQTARFERLMAREYESDGLPLARVHFLLPEGDADPSIWDDRTKDLNSRVSGHLLRGQSVVIEEENEIISPAKRDGKSGSGRLKVRQETIETQDQLQKYFISLCIRKSEAE